MKYLVGIDGGGTRSRLLAVGLDGSVVGSARGKSTSVESNPISVVRQNLMQLIQSFTLTHSLSLDDCAALCFGTAGVDTQASKRKMEQMLDSLNLKCPTSVVNDAEIALHANTKGGPGIILISGTGSICYGSNQAGDVFRVGGFGYILGDEGSSYWVARRGLTAALHAHDTSGPPTRMLNDFCKALKIQEIEEVIDFVYQKNKSDLGKLSYVVTNAHQEGDGPATVIMQEALDSLCLHVETVAQRLGMVGESFPLLLGGGFLLASQWLSSQVTQRMEQYLPGVHVAPMSAIAEWGAIYHAAALVGIDSNQLNQQRDLLEQTL